jgi:uncharacterized phage protein gp47/JayE
VAGFTPTGFEPKSLAETQTTISEKIHDAIDPRLNLSETSLDGQKIGTFSAEVRMLWEALQDAVANMDPDQAEGAPLRSIGRYTGTTDVGPLATTVLIDATLAAGTYAAGDLIIYVDGSPEVTFSNDAEVVAPGGVVEGVPFTAESTGPTVVNASSPWVLSSPPSGFTAATNPAAGVTGTLPESDAAFRQRRWRELRRQGSASTDAIAADLADVEGVTFARVIENVSDVTVDGYPPHSITAFVLGGTDEDVATAIRQSKAGGIRAYGTTTVTTTDAQGNVVIIGFIRPTGVTVYVDVTITAQAGAYIGDEAVANLLADWAATNQGVGKDVIRSKLVALLVNDETGIYDASIELGASEGTETAANFAISPSQYATITAGNIDVTSTLVNGAP